MQDVPVYLDGVGSVRALNNVIVRAQVDGKLIAVNFAEGQDVKKGDVLGEIDPVIYQAQYDQAVAKKAQDEAQLANQRARSRALSAARARPTPARSSKPIRRSAVVAQQEALVKADQAAIDNAAGDARLHQDRRAVVRPCRPAPGRSGQHHPRRPTPPGSVIITQLQPIAVQFQPAAAADRAGQRRRRPRARCAVDVFGNDGVTVVDTGTLKGIDNQVDPDHRHAEAEGRIPQRQFPALAGPVRQCAPEGRNPAARRSWCRPPRCSAARRHLQLRHRRRRHRHRQTGRGDAAERNRCGDRAAGFRPPTAW